MRDVVGFGVVIVILLATDLLPVDAVERLPVEADFELLAAVLDVVGGLGRNVVDRCAQLLLGHGLGVNGTGGGKERDECCGGQCCLEHVVSSWRFGNRVTGTSFSWRWSGARG